MAAEQPETDAFLAFIERKIAALQALADSYRNAQALGALGQPGDEAPSYSAAAFSMSGSGQLAANSAPYDLPTGVFLNKTMPAAIKVFLAATKRKQTPKEVATALKEGGFESTSKFFEKIVTTTMHRMKNEGDLLQFKDGWGLAELYPESLRIRITKDAEAKPKRGRPRKNVRKSPQRKGSVAKPKDTAPAHTGPKPVPSVA